MRDERLLPKLTQAFAFTLSLALCVAQLSAVAWAQNQDPTISRTPAFQLEHFEPTGDSAHSVFNIASAEVQGARQLTSGLVCHYASQPAVLDPVSGEGGAILTDVTRCEVLASIGLFGQGSLSLALPITVLQRGAQLDVFNLGDDVFNGAQLGDLRLSPKMQLFKRNEWGLAAAVMTPIHLPTGDGLTLNSAGGVQVGARLILDWVFNQWHLMGNLGYRLLNPLQLHNVILDDSTRWGIALKTPPIAKQLYLSASVYGNQSSADNLNPRDLSQASDDGRNDPIEALTALSWRPVNSDWTLKLGAGIGLNEGIGAARWRGLLGVDWTPTLTPPPSVASIDSAPHLGVDLQAIIYAPSLLGAIPFMSRRNSSSSPDTLLSVNTATAGEPADLAIKLELGQASALGAASLGESIYTSVHVAWVIKDDLQLAFEVPSVFGGQPIPSLGSSAPTLLPRRDDPRVRDQAGARQAIGLGDMRVQLKTLALDGFDKTLGAGLVIPVTLPTATLSGYGRERMRIGSMGTTTWRTKWADLTQNIGVHIEDNFNTSIPLSSIFELGLAANVKLSSRYRLGVEAFTEQPFSQSDYRDMSDLYGGGVMVGHHAVYGLSWDIGVRGLQVSDQHQIDLVFKWRWRGEAPPRSRPQPRSKPRPKSRPKPKQAPLKREVVKPPPIMKPPVPPSVPSTSLDLDGDGISDKEDQCPQEDEDFDGFQDEDGCPDKDNDGDSVEDDRDRCPMTRGIRAWDGCNDKVIQVLFESGQAALLSSSNGALEEIAGLIKSHPEIKMVLIQGHTDDTGSAEDNQRLSEARALAVKGEMMKRGVESSRRGAIGLASSQPVVSIQGLRGRALKSARAKNRRVVFILSFEKLKLERLVSAARQGPRRAQKQSSAQNQKIDFSGVKIWGSQRPTLAQRGYPYSVLVSSFRSRAYAEQLSARLSALHPRLKPWIFEVNLGAKGVRYRVLVGQFRSRSDAQVLVPLLSRGRLRPRATSWTRWTR